MATETIYRGQSGNAVRWYTAEGFNDAAAWDANLTLTGTAEATVKTYTVSVIDAARLKIRYGSTATYSRVENGVRKTYSNAATDRLTVKVYRSAGGSNYTVYGANPVLPGFGGAASSPGTAICAIEQDGTKAKFRAGWIFEENAYGSFAANRQSGTEYDAAKVTYDATNGRVFFGADAADGKSFVLCATYPWFMAVFQHGMPGYTISPDPNDAATRTVAVGKKAAYVSDAADYNTGSNASLSVETSKSGSRAEFGYWKVIHRHLGPYLPESENKILKPWLGTINGQRTVLRGVTDTGSANSGTFYPVGSDISDILTRNPSIDTYDTRVALTGVFAACSMVTVNANGGTGGTGTFYIADDGTLYTDLANLVSVPAVEAPTYDGWTFDGLFDSADAAAAKRVDADGTVVNGWIPSGDVTLYAHWHATKEVTLDRNGGAEGTGDGLIIYDSSVGGFVRSGEAAAIASVSVPARAGFAFLGYFSAAEGSATQYIAADGEILSALTSLGLSAPGTIYARWERRCYRAELSLNGEDASGGLAEIYCNGTDATFYSDDRMEHAVDSVPEPELTGHTFLGYYSAAAGGTCVIPADGSLDEVAAFGEDLMLYARWSANAYTLTFDAAGGTASFETKTVTFGEAVGTLAAITEKPNSEFTFLGWYLGGERITGDTVWLHDGDGTLVAKWDTGFGDVEDFFGLGSATLVPFESDEGTNRPHVVTRHYGKAAGASQSGPVWRNPSVKYMVVGDMMVNVTLGKAFAKVTGNIDGPYVNGSGQWAFGNHRGMAESGYMITEVAIATRRRQFPVVTVSAVANEGENAINQFTVMVNVRARARAQNLLGGVSGGGELQAVTLRAACDPVVLAEGAEPCASDAVNGRYELHAETLAAKREAAPAAAGGFTSTGEPAAFAGTEYVRYRLSARREITN